MYIVHTRLNYTNICRVCRTKFHPFRRGAIYCSRNCWFESRRKGKLVKCAFCSKEVYKKLKVLKMTHLLYCSKQCKNDDSRYTTASAELRRQAHTAVKRARGKGELIPQPCKVCREPATHAHHYNGYDKRNWFNVEWLCGKHHAKLHQQMIKERNNLL